MISDHHLNIIRSESRTSPDRTSTMQFEFDLERSIQNLSPDAVNAALRKHVDPKRMVVVVGGDVKPGTVK